VNPTNAHRERILAAVDADAAVSLLSEAVRIPSVTGDEAAVAELLAGALREAGAARVDAPEFAPGRRNAWGVVEGSGGDGDGLLLLGHLDTVHVRGWEERWAGTERESPYGVAIVDGEMWGRGTADQKAGVVTVVAALKALRDAGLRPRNDVAALFVGDEESGEPGSGYSDGIKALLPLVEQGVLPSASFAIYTEPTTLQVYAAQMGFLTADITVHGRSSYFGTPWLGRDALRAAHRLLDRLWQHSDDLWQQAEHPLLGRAFLLVTGIEGGGYIAVPGECRISLIRKILPHEDLDAVRGELDALLRQAAINDAVEATITYTAPRDHAVGGTPSEAPLDTPALVRLQRIASEVRPGKGQAEGAPYWSEMSFLQKELGIPAVYFAPGDIKTAHTLEERVDVEEFLDAVRILALFIAEHCGIDEI
jgi:acetylornithine deacetylase